MVWAVVYKHPGALFVEWMQLILVHRDFFLLINTFSGCWGSENYFSKVASPPTDKQNKWICETNFDCWQYWLQSSSYKHFYTTSKKDCILLVSLQQILSKFRQYLPIKISEVYFKRDSWKAKCQFHLFQFLSLQQISPCLSQRHKWSLWSTNYCGAAPWKSMFSPSLVQTTYQKHYYLRCFIRN